MPLAAKAERSLSPHDMNRQLVSPSPLPHLITDPSLKFGRLSKKGQNLFGFLVSSLQITELNTFYNCFLLDIFNTTLK